MASQFIPQFCLAGVIPGLERDGVKIVLYLQLGQLSQLLCSIKDELSALEETGRQRDRWKKGVVVIMTIKGSSKWLSVKQKTATFLTHSFKPLYRCQGAFSFKCCYHTYLFYLFPKITHTRMHTHTNKQALTHACTHARTDTQSKIFQ